MTEATHFHRWNCDNYFRKASMLRTFHFKYTSLAYWM